MKNCDNEICDIFNNLNINYVSNHTFDMLKNQCFNYYLPDYNCCIEYYDNQYFNENNNNINKKINYCKNNNIVLLNIPYGFKKKIKKILTIEYNNKFTKSINYENCVLIIAGTRPEELKTIKLVDELENNSIPVLYVFTGQHKNLINQEKYDFICNINENDELNRLDLIVNCNIENFNELFKKHPYIKYVLVQGDTTSAMAVALTSFHHRIKVIHLEAGLRTYDSENPYPEEINRKLISQIANFHLCPTNLSADNLRNEKIDNNIFVVGNTVIDNLLPYKDNCEYDNKILITLHRRENHHWLDQWFTEIDNLAKLYPQYEFILPMHPNPNVQKHKHLLKYVKIINPLPYEDMLNLLVKTKLVITDSGGLQEECSFFNKKCLVCRKITERPEAINQSSFMVESPDKLKELFIEHIEIYEINYKCPFGDGNSVKKICNMLKELLR
ncbi:UDP-N-acetylglucosamine 2-epimerase (non-hydrolyzing) [Candidatus Dojkabacteria bacterium]|jgi:UDP-N-acetylglucosamine 2-epimerase (non-hydrolysing)|nr:UDP-N-acetylglucosamine 2-epimerase (non-hydrolyzing) [Candidatus Dojkabacteria bacterium]